MGGKISKRGSYDLTKREKKSSKLQQRPASVICLTEAQIYEDFVRTPTTSISLENFRYPNNRVSEIVSEDVRASQPSTIYGSSNHEEINKKPEPSAEPIRNSISTEESKTNWKDVLQEPFWTDKEKEREMQVAAYSSDEEGNTSQVEVVDDFQDTKQRKKSNLKVSFNENELKNNPEEDIYKTKDDLSVVGIEQEQEQDEKEKPKLHHSNSATPSLYYESEDLWLLDNDTENDEQEEFYDAQEFNEIDLSLKNKIEAKPKEELINKDNFEQINLNYDLPDKNSAINDVTTENYNFNTTEETSTKKNLKNSINLIENGNERCQVIKDETTNINKIIDTINNNALVLTTINNHGTNNKATDDGSNNINEESNKNLANGSIIFENSINHQIFEHNEIKINPLNLTESTNQMPSIAESDSAMNKTIENEFTDINKNIDTINHDALLLAIRDDHDSFGNNNKTDDEFINQEKETMLEAINAFKIEINNAIVAQDALTQTIVGDNKIQTNSLVYNNCINKEESNTDSAKHQNETDDEITNSAENIQSTNYDPLSFLTISNQSGFEIVNRTDEDILDTKTRQIIELNDRDLENTTEDSIYLENSAKEINDLQENVESNKLQINLFFKENFNESESDSDEPPPVVGSPPIELDSPPSFLDVNFKQVSIQNLDLKEVPLCKIEEKQEILQTPDLNFRISEKTIKISSDNNFDYAFGSEHDDHQHKNANDDDFLPVIGSSINFPHEIFKEKPTNNLIAFQSTTEVHKNKPSATKSDDFKLFISNSIFVADPNLKRDEEEETYTTTNRKLVLGDDKKLQYMESSNNKSENVEIKEISNPEDNSEISPDEGKVQEPKSPFLSPMVIEKNNVKIWEEQSENEIERVISEVNTILGTIKKIKVAINNLGKNNEGDKDVQVELYQSLIKIMRDVNCVNNQNFNEKILELQHNALNEVHECLNELKSKS